MTLNDAPVSRPRRRLVSDWRLTVRFRHDDDDDLIEHLHRLPSGHRAVTIREAVHRAVQIGLTHNGRFSQGSRRDRPDLRVTIRFRHGEDDRTIAFLQSLPSRKRSAFVRQAFRATQQPSETHDTG